MANVTPELAVSDIERSLQFYTSLGFTKDNEGIVDDKGSQWYSLALGDAALWLIREDVVEGSYGDRPFGHGVNLYIAVEDVDGLYDKVKASGLEKNITKKIETMWYGLRHFSLTDPDGYLLTLNMAVPAEEQTPPPSEG